ncbi:MAG: hypothetical protein ACFCUS_14135 [Rubrimonas sp.]
MIPAVYSLLRRLAQYRARCWRSGDLDGILSAPIYVFADQEAFDSDAVEALGRVLCTEPLRLPHARVVFELAARGPMFEAQVVYAWQVGHEVEAVFFGKQAGARRWSDVCAHVEFTSDGHASVETNPLIPEEDWPQYAEVSSAMVWRALAILKHAGTVTEQTVSRVHRPKLARAGLRGWTWSQVSIAQERLVRVTAPRGGSHASPRWHIRRGHWRQLADGRRVFVRECEVGDATRGGVVKDYAVEAPRA